MQAEVVMRGYEESSYKKWGQGPVHWERNRNGPQTYEKNTQFIVI